jgi:putative phage-type endonuclease
MASPAPETPPAPGEFPAPRTASKSPAGDDGTVVAGAKAGEEPFSPTPALKTPPAPYGITTGPGAASPASGPVPLSFPTARVLLPAGAPTEDWHAVRRTGVGGSDVSAILGLDTHGGALRVWQDKVGIPRATDSRLERSARRGHRLEGLTAEFFSEESGLLILDAPGTLQHLDHPHWLANPDRITLWPDDARAADPGILECKSRTWRSARAEGWRGDEAPDGPALQAHWYLTVTGYQHAHVAGLIDDELVWWQLWRDDELCQLLADAVDRFWTDHVLTGIPPAADGSQATAELLARLWTAREEATVEVDPVEAMLLNQRRRELKERQAALETDLTEVENRMRQLAGDAEVATVGGKPVFTWRQNGQFAHRRFREAEPELAAEYTHYVPAIDTAWLAKDHPETYRTYRARVLRTPSEG